MEPCTVFVVGPESCGKSTLVLQLQSIAEGRGILAPPEELIVAPTTGQEIVSIDVAMPLELLRWSLGNAGQQIGGMYGEQHAPPASGSSNEEAMQGVGPSDASSRIANAPPGMLTHARRISIREFGGRMAPSWGKFIESRLSSKGLEHPEATHALIFMIDATKPWQLPVAAIEFATLCRSAQIMQLKPRVLLLVNRVCAPHACDVEDPLEPSRVCASDITQLFADPLDDGKCNAAESTGPAVDVLWIDTWIGVGLVDVLLWMQEAFSST